MTVSYEVEIGESREIYRAETVEDVVRLYHLIEKTPPERLPMWWDIPDEIGRSVAEVEQP